MSIPDAQRSIHRLEAWQEAMTAIHERAKTLPVGRPNSRARHRWAAHHEAADVILDLVLRERIGSPRHEHP